MDKALLAKEILQNPLWEEVFKELSEYYYESFRASRDLEEKTRIAIANDILDDFEAVLTQRVANAAKLPVGDNT